MNTTFFPGVDETISYEGPSSDNPLAFSYYDPDRKVGDRTLAEHLRFSVAYWHTFRGDGSDMFGAPTFDRDWRQAADPMERAKDTMRAAFEFFRKLGVDYYCFHDLDIAPQGDTFAETKENIWEMVELASELQEETGTNLLWGTANLFEDPIYAHGAASSPDPEVFAHAVAQVRNAMKATHELGGENYVFWGGREGYTHLLNTDYKQEQKQLARFFEMAAEYREKIGFEGQLLIEPKPREPSKHQYDYDAATVLAFLEQHDLIDQFSLNVESNHATLAGHTFDHELTVASAAGKLGSVDANRGDLLLGWDTDLFPNDLYETVRSMLVILEQGGIAPGGLNFDAKVRRGSIDTKDLFHAHVGAMDTFARGLLIAHRIIEDGALEEFRDARYEGYEHGIGKDIMTGAADVESLEEWVLENGRPTPQSGRQEAMKNVINSYIGTVSE